MSNDPTQVNAGDYRQVFEHSPVGKDVLLHLRKVFYDRLSFEDLNPHGTSYKEGQRSVIHYILEVLTVPDEPQDDTHNSQQ